jgi:hypothetical protein
MAMPDAPAGIPRVTWQSVAARVLDHSRRPDLDDVSRWLLRELYGYLREERLSDEAPLTPATVFALSAYPDAERSITRIVEIARAVVEAGWGPPKNYAKRGGATPAYGVGWWASHEVAPDGAPTSPAWINTWFEWTVRSDHFRAEPRDAVAFFAGATFATTKGSPLSAPGSDAWLAAHYAAGFERVSDYYVRLWRPRYTEQLLVDERVDAQGQRLGEWVLDCFRTLAATPPPVDPSS